MTNTPEQIDDIPISTVDSPSVVLEIIFQLKVKDVMCGTVITARKTDTLRHIQALMKENYITGIPVVEGRNLLGIVSTEDIIMALDRGVIDHPAEELMTRNVIVLESDMPLSFAISCLNKYHYGRFPVLNKNKELVGILTPKDVVRTLLMEMNREVLRLEKIHQKEARIPDRYSEMEFTTVRHDFELAGHASTEIKKALKLRNIDPKVIRRVAIASYELEINQVVHSLGGTITCSIHPDKIIIAAADNGPGIADIDLVLQEGWSTADEWIRSLGFGAGMGLPNVKRVSDEFTIESSLGSGTTVRSVIYVNSPKEEGAV
ncbi:MAG: CBS domain-containing protein [Treponema sp.]|nr:CBS domain-containing protein [Treponema sp.]